MGEKSGVFRFSVSNRAPSTWEPVRITYLRLQWVVYRHPLRLKGWLFGTPWKVLVDVFLKCQRTNKLL